MTGFYFRERNVTHLVVETCVAKYWCDLGPISDLSTGLDDADQHTSGSCASQQYQWNAASCLSHVWRVMSGCTDTVGECRCWVNLMQQAWWCSLAVAVLLGLGSLFLFQWVLADSIARILLCVWLPVRKMGSFPKNWEAECIRSERIKQTLIPIHIFFNSFLFYGTLICKFWREA